MFFAACAIALISAVIWPLMFRFLATLGIMFLILRG